MYDAAAESIPVAQQGEHRKKAILIVSDGNDTNSRVSVPELTQMIRETEVRLPFPFPRGGIRRWTRHAVAARAHAARLGWPRQRWWHLRRR